MDVLQEYLDMRILLRSSFQATKSRREARKGYAVDGEGGWWVDPVGYVEDVVWPAYVDEHSFLFVDGDVEGVVQWDVAWLRGIDVAPLRIAGGSGSGHGDGGGEEREVELGELLGWVVDVVARRVGEILGGSVDGEG